MSHTCYTLTLQIMFPLHTPPIFYPKLQTSQFVSQLSVCDVTISSRRSGGRVLMLVPSFRLRSRLRAEDAVGGHPAALYLQMLDRSIAEWLTSLASVVSQKETVGVLFWFSGLGCDH